MTRDELTDYLRDLAERRGATARGIARALDMPFSVVTRTLRGDTAKVDTLERIANHLGMELTFAPIVRT